MQRWKTWMLLVVPVVVAFLLSTVSAGTASAWFEGAWHIVPSPNVSGSTNVLNGVSAISKHDAWAVGQTLSLSAGSNGTLTEHWNGTSWRIVTSLGPGSRVNVLSGVTALAANDVWAVGHFTNTGGSAQTLILHWNGKAWKVVSSPNVLSSDNFLTGVAAVSNEDIWAVGSYFNANSGTLQTLLEHWNGHHWSLFFTMNPPAGNNALQSVTAITEDNVWAVGTTTDPITNNSRTLIEHWNGRSWRAVTSPNPGSRLNVLNGVAADAARDIWAVGSYSNSIGGPAPTLTLHWNGSTWKIVSSPNANTPGNQLVAVAVVSPSDVWAVGNSTNSSGINRTLTLHWNGAKWSVVFSPNRGTDNNFLRGVARIPRTENAWAVGYFGSSTGDKTLVESFSE